MRTLILLTTVCSVVGCESSPDGAPSDGVTTEPVPCVDANLCLDEGSNAFGTDERAVEVRLPAERQGAPVVFVWHYLSGNPDDMMAWMGVDQLVDAGYVVVTPASRGLPYTEWDVQSDAGANPDVRLFDEILAQIESQYATDPDRVYATGFSAGGLFSSYLTMNRGDVLAATAPFSGGVPSALYAAPESDLPVMLAWGGAFDTYGGFDFAAATQEFAEALVDDGHEVVECPHAMGHWLPDDAQEHVLAFFDDHGGEGARPWSASPDQVPSGCSLVAR